MAKVQWSALLQTVANVATAGAVVFGVWAYYHPYVPPTEPTTGTQANQTVPVPPPQSQPQEADAESVTLRSVNWSSVSAISGLILAGVLQLVAATIRARGTGSRSALEAIKSAFSVRTLGVYVPQTRLDALERQLDNGSFFIKTTEGPNTPVINLGKVVWREADMDDAMKRANALMSPADLAKAHETLAYERDSLKRALDEAERERERIRGLLGAAQTETLEVKQRHAEDVLAWRSRMKFGDKTPTVTIRFAKYGADYKLAERIKKIFEKHTDWPVTLDNGNTPVLPEAGQFKVLVETAFTLSFDDVAWALGQLLCDISVGKRTGAREDSQNLIIEVNPSP